MWRSRALVAVVLLAALAARGEAVNCHLERSYTEQKHNTNNFAYTQEHELTEVLGRMSAKATGVQKAADFDTYTIKANSILFHGTLPSDGVAARILAGGKQETWFSPDDCQSFGHACKRAHANDEVDIDQYAHNVEYGGPTHAPMAVFKYKVKADFDVVRIKTVKQAGRDRPGYPVLVDTVPGIVDLSGTKSSDNTVAKYVRHFCEYAESVGAKGWRNPDDQDEVMLCATNRAEFLELVDHDLVTFTCPASEMDHSIKDECPGKKMLYGTFSIQTCKGTRDYTSSCVNHQPVCACDEKKKAQQQRLKPQQASCKAKKKKGDFWSMLCCFSASSAD